MKKVFYVLLSFLERSAVPEVFLVSSFLSWNKWSIFKFATLRNLKAKLLQFQKLYVCVQWSFQKKNWFDFLLVLCTPWKCSSRKAELKLRAFSKGLKNIEPEKSDRFSDLSSSFSPWALAVHNSQKRPNFVWWPILQIKDKSPGPENKTRLFLYAQCALHICFET
jgi:hypothetical protein